VGFFEMVDRIGDAASHVPIPTNPFRMARQGAEIVGGGRALRRVRARRRYSDALP
jgi:hypothetical protein